MGRIRYIKPGFFTNEELATLPPIVRLLFAGLWTLADCKGRLEDRPKRIKAELFAYDTFDIDAALNELHEAGFILRYAVRGVFCIQIVSFGKHQRPHPNEPTAKLPEPPKYGAKKKTRDKARSRSDKPIPKGSIGNFAQGIDLDLNGDCNGDGDRNSQVDQDQEPADAVAFSRVSNEKPNVRVIAAVIRKGKLTAEGPDADEDRKLAVARANVGTYDGASMRKGLDMARATNARRDS